MSLGIVFKGPEGIVLAADSRVTLHAEMLDGQQRTLIPASFDSATKLLYIPGKKHRYVGAITYGLGAIGAGEPRTPHSFIPELEDRFKGKDRMSVEAFAQEFSDFFMEQWEKSMPGPHAGPNITFLIGGYDEEEIHGRVFKVEIPTGPTPQEQHAGQFGVTWGGQLQYTTRLIKGYDPRLPELVQSSLGLSDEQKAALEQQLAGNLSLRIPYQFLPLQDCVDLSVFLIRTTIQLQTWVVDVRGVGGAIDVATITRAGGIELIQKKTVVAS